MTFDTTMYGRIHTWYTAHGLFATAALSDGGETAPVSFSLAQNYPNPFNPATTITYTLPATAHVTLKVFDLLGQEVATLVDRSEPAGMNSVRFDASRLSSGAYYYRIAAGSYVATRQMLLIR